MSAPYRREAGARGLPGHASSSPNSRYVPPSLARVHSTRWRDGRSLYGKNQDMYSRGERISCHHDFVFLAIGEGEKGETVTKNKARMRRGGGV